MSRSVILLGVHRKPNHRGRSVPSAGCFDAPIFPPGSASVDESRQSLILSGEAGHSQLRYGGLFAYDADGKQLLTWLELKGKSPLLRVRDESARYPLVIDPLIELAQLTASNGRAGDEFGLTIAVCGRTVVVGASQLNSSTIGAAYDCRPEPSLPAVSLLLKTEQQRAYL